MSLLCCFFSMCFSPEAGDMFLRNVGFNRSHGVVYQNIELFINILDQDSYRRVHDVTYQNVWSLHD
jgi:hypothetical protein